MPSEQLNIGTAEADSVAFTAADGFTISGRLWRPIVPQAKACVVINAGAGIRMRYYDRFAGFLSSRGVPTLIYDYRGIGESRPPKLESFGCSVEDWGSKDCVSALDYLGDRYPDLQLTLLCHSIGGFLAGFITNPDRISRLMLIGAHNAFWRDYAIKYRANMYVAWHLVMPLITSIAGYFPGRRLRLGEDLPYGVAMEWAGRRSPEFWRSWRFQKLVSDVAWRDDVLNRFAKIHVPALTLSATDDAFATEAAIKRITDLYVNCRFETKVISPRDVGRKRVGHLGYFHQDTFGSQWPWIFNWIVNSQHQG